MKKSTLISVIATALMFCCLIGTTYAWLVAKSDPIVNTYTSGNINISLTVSNSVDRKMLPGATLTENPQVIVDADSEDCWLFVKIEKTENFDAFLSYDIADGWTLLEDNTGVYYRNVKTSTANQAFGIIKDNKLTAKTAATKEMYDSLNANNYPTLTFTAYAVQELGFSTPALAWAEAKTLVQQ